MKRVGGWREKNNFVIAAIASYIFARKEPSSLER